MHLRRQQQNACAALLAVAMTACAARAPVQNYRGVLIRGFEQLQFRPCARTTEAAQQPDRWLPVFSAAAAVTRDSLAGTLRTNTMFLEVVGSIGKPTTIGHLGQLTRVLSVERILNAGDRMPADCAWTLSLR